VFTIYDEIYSPLIIVTFGGIEAYP